jgi:hypothetical protein
MVVTVRFVGMVVKTSDLSPVVVSPTVWFSVVFELYEEPIDITSGRPDFDADVRPTVEWCRLFDVGRFHYATRVDSPK